MVDPIAPQSGADSSQVIGAARRVSRIDRLLPVLIPFLTILVLLSPSIVWVARDHSVWRWDQAWYAEVSSELYYQLRHDRPQWKRAMDGLMPSKPPGLPWIGQFFIPLGKRLGSIELGLHCAILLCQAITLLMIFRMGRVLNPAQGLLTGVVGCVLAAAAPIFAGLTHQFFVEPLQTLAVTWFYYCALCSPRWSRLRILNHLIAATTLALLAKTTSPLYCLLPGLIATCQLFRSRFDTTDAKGPMALAGRLVCLVVALRLMVRTLAWYHNHWDDVMRHAWQSSFGVVALDYGHQDEFLNKFGFWFRSIHTYLFCAPVFWIWAYLTVVGIVSWSTRVGREGWCRLPAVTNCLALAGGLHILGVMVMFSLNINEDCRFLMPLLPAVGVLAMWAVTQTSRRALSIGLILAALLQWGYIHSRTLHILECKERIFWVVPYEPSALRSEELMRAAHMINKEAPFKQHIVGVDFDWCSPNTLSFYSTKDMVYTGRRAYFTSLGYGERDMLKSMERIEQVKMDYFISVEDQAQPQPPDFLNQTSLPVLQQIRSDRTHYAPVDFPNESQIVIFRRIPTSTGNAQR